MTARERKLLRKKVNSKLKCLANKESKENDFLYSSQIITDRQQKYMTISKYFRAQDNNRKPRNLPFRVDKTSLPHVNLSLLGRLHRATDSILRSEELDKVVNAHAFRTVTPFYINPQWTIDRGNVMNYSAHVGTILHTPRYIDFIKNTPEYASSAKSQQRPQTEGRKSPSYSRSSASTSVVYLSCESEGQSTSSQSQCSSGTSKSQKSTKSVISSETLESISRRPSQNTEETITKLRKKKSSIQSLDRSTITSSPIGKQDKHAPKKEADDEESSYHSNESLHDTDTKPEVSKDMLISKIDVHEGIQHEVLQRQDAVDNYEAKVEEEYTYEDADFTSSSSTTLSAVKNEGVEVSKKLLIEEMEDFFKDALMEKGDFDLISRFIETVDKHRLSRPDYVQEYGNHLLKYNLPKFQRFHQILSKYKLTDISDEDSEYISNLIRKCDWNHTILNRQTSTDSFFETTLKKVKENTSLDKIGDPAKDLLDEKKEEPDKKVERKETAEISSDEDDDFAESFKNLFRNSIAGMTNNDIKNLRNLIYECDLKEPNENKAKEDSRERRFSKCIEEEDSISDDEDNETMMAFRNLFRSSIRGIRKSHLEEIHNLINEHENDF